jgi:hypothetical protein
MGLLGLHRLHPEGVDRPAHGVHVHIGDPDVGSGLGEVLDQVVADLPHARDDDADLLERGGPKGFLGAGPEPLEHAVRGHGGRVA